MHKKERYLRQLAKEYDVPYLYSTVNASKKSGVPASFIRKLINEGTIPAYYIGKKIMVFEDSLKTMSTLYKNYIRDKEKSPYMYTNMFHAIRLNIMIQLLVKRHLG